MRLTILGNNGPYPAPGGACSGYLLETDDASARVLMDCGTGVLARLSERVSIEALDAILLSHLHFDHMSDMLPLHYLLQFHPLPRRLIVAAPDTPQDVRGLLPDAQIDLRGTEPLVIGGMNIDFMRVRHPVETYAIRVRAEGKTLVYTGDTNTVPGLVNFCSGADLLRADAGLSAADYAEGKPHLSAELCGRLAKDAGAKRLLLTHFNPKYDPDALLAEAREAFPAAEIARLGALFAL